MNDNNLKISFFLDVIKRYDHYIATTNFKIGLMMSFLMTLIIGLTVQMNSHDHRTIEFFDYMINPIMIAVTLTILLSTIAIFQLIRAVSPNTSNSVSEKSLIFFGDVCSFKNGSTGYYEKLWKLEKMTY